MMSGPVDGGSGCKFWQVHGQIPLSHAVAVAVYLEHCDKVGSACVSADDLTHMLRVEALSVSQDPAKLHHPFRRPRGSPSRTGRICDRLRDDHSGKRERWHPFRMSAVERQSG
jgi:hypothetical protein